MKHILLFSLLFGASHLFGQDLNFVTNKGKIIAMPKFDSSSVFAAVGKKVDTSNSFRLTLTPLSDGQMFKYFSSDSSLHNFTPPFILPTDTAAMLANYAAMIAANSALITRYAVTSQALTGTDDTTTLTSVLNASGFSLPVAINRKYRITARLRVSCDGSGGMLMGLSAPTGTVITSGSWISTGTTVAGTVGSAAAVVGSVSSNALHPRAGTGGWVFLSAEILTSSTSGNIGLIWRSLTLGQKSTIVAGTSSWDIQEML